MPSPQFFAGSPGWMPRAACRSEDPELFFPITAVGPALTQVFAAKAVCLRCAVRARCLSYALATGQAGIWGGTTQEERHAMRRSSRLPAPEHASPGSLNAAVRHHGNHLPGSDPCAPTDSCQPRRTPGTISAAAAETASGTTRAGSAGPP